MKLNRYTDEHKGRSPFRAADRCSSVAAVACEQMCSHTMSNHSSNRNLSMKDARKLTQQLSVTLCEINVDVLRICRDEVTANPVNRCSLLQKAHHGRNTLRQRLTDMATIIDGTDASDDDGGDRQV